MEICFFSCDLLCLVVIEWKDVSLMIFVSIYCVSFCLGYGNLVFEVIDGLGFGVLRFLVSVLVFLVLWSVGFKFDVVVILRILDDLDVLINVLVLAVKLLQLAD